MTVDAHTRGLSIELAVEKSSSGQKKRWGSVSTTAETFLLQYRNKQKKNILVFFRRFKIHSRCFV